MASPRYAKYCAVKTERQNTGIADIIGIADIVSKNIDILSIKKLLLTQHSMPCTPAVARAKTANHSVIMFSRMNMISCVLLGKSVKSNFHLAIKRKTRLITGIGGNIWHRHCDICIL